MRITSIQALIILKSGLLYFLILHFAIFLSLLNRTDEMSNTKQWKIVDLLKTTTEFFTQKQIENPRLNAEVLLAHVLNKTRIKLYIEFERPVSEGELIKFREYVSRRSKNEPLQYITGQTEFMGLPFAVNSSVLIPRPETEILCENVLKLKDNYPGKINILDIGTGSGCIAISLAHFWNNAHITAIDISAEALKIADQNARDNKIQNLNFIQQDLFSITDNIHLKKKFEIIVSNPPYIAQNEMADLQNEVKDFEPEHALTDFSDGMSFYKFIMDLISKEQLKCDYLFFEMSGSQPKKIVEETKKRNFEYIEIIKDLNAIDRVLKIQK